MQLLHFSLLLTLSLFDVSVYLSASFYLLKDRKRFRLEQKAKLLK